MREASKYAAQYGSVYSIIIVAEDLHQARLGFIEWLDERLTGNVITSRIRLKRIKNPSDPRPLYIA